VVLQPSAASSQLARSNANSTAPGLLPAATDVTYVLGQYTRPLGEGGYRELAGSVARGEALVIYIRGLFDVCDRS